MVERPSVRIAIAAMLVVAGCFLGAWFGTWLRFPDVGAAVLFPPYAILTAALWRSQPRHWWVFLLAASVGNFYPHYRDGGQVAFVLLAEIVNHSRAVLAAFALRSCCRSNRMDSVRELSVYLGAVVFVAPCVAALGGATLATTLGGADAFGIAWQEWWLSNAITGLVLLPILVFEGRRFRVTVPRLLEAAVLAISLLAIGAHVFTTDFDHTSHEHLYWAVPFLLWAAVRFGLRGVGVALLAVTTLSIYGAVDGRGPFFDDLLEMQVFLFALSIPMLLLAVLIEEQRRTATELEESRRHYRSIVEDQSELICRFRPDGTYTFANRAYGETFGHAPGALVGTSIWSSVPNGVHESRRGLAAITIANPIATREVSVATEHGVRWLQWQDRALFDEHGAVVEYQAVGRDITDRKRAEDEHRELESRKSVEAALREADRRKDEFLAMLGHELRNPLAPIGIGIRILLDAAPNSADATWARESLQRQLGHMTRLLDDLLDISRITHGKIELQLEHVDLGLVIANAVEATRPIIDPLRHTLTISLPDHPLVIRADAVRLTQVFANLLNNAAKYTQHGGRIAVVVTRDDAGITISVRDNGIGIAPESLEEIFELFSQMPAARERAQGGLGIGLTLVRKIVELHGGTVEAHSDGPERGSEIVVRLSGAVPDLPAIIEPVPRARKSGPLRILAVDDNIDIADGLAAVLKLWGHTVHTAHDGAAALEAVEEFTPDVVLLDLGLPRMNGLEVARRLRDRSEAPLLVSMSGFGHDQTRVRSNEAGFHHHLVKPIDLDSLQALLDDWRAT